MQFYTPSSEVSIDELMVQYFGRSIHTYKMPSKPIQQGYKLFGIADHGYLYAFRWSSKAKGMKLKDTILYPKLTNTSCLVQSLALSLP
jgi:anaphase-promoting complex subunit 8